MRDFNEASKVRKSTRIQIPNNPDKLSKEKLLQLEALVKESLKDGYLSCSVAWEIANEANITKIAIGDIADRLGVRITNCQIGFFKKDKTAYDNPEHKSIDGEIITILKALNENTRLTCAKVFELARQFRLKPITIAHEAGAQDLKIIGCQLGCF
ncbi:hypothetical protein ACFLYB_04125 [Chloroflexota bacterium]